MTNFEGEQSTETAPFSPEDIIWTPNAVVVDEESGEPVILDDARIERAKTVIGLLLERGARIVEFIDDDYAYNLPTLYEFKGYEGLEVEFLPHLNFYRLGELHMTLPTNTQTINKDLVVAKDVADDRARITKNSSII